MSDISTFMTGDHRRCDDLLATTEQQVAKGQLAEASKSFGVFHAAMLVHFEAEEQTLFPAFEARTGFTQGPTRVMRMEHQQIRGLLDEAAQSLADQDADAYLSAADTLVIMMQQHNMKEENVLYPMCDQHLFDDAESLVRQIGEALVA